jgi:hypothetical protein
VPEVRVAAGITTTLRFDAPIDRTSVEVEGQEVNFRFVDVGERTLVLEPALELAPGKRLGVRVRYRDGAFPSQAAFALVSHPIAVDGLVEVVRRPDTSEWREPEGPAGLVLSGVLDSWGVWTRPFAAQVPPDNRSGLEVKKGVSYRARSWVVVSLHVRNLPGQKPWSPGSARLTGLSGVPVTVRSVRMKDPLLQPGEMALVVVEAEPPGAGEKTFWLELVDREGGRHLSVGVQLRELEQ